MTQNYSSYNEYINQSRSKHENDFASFPNNQNPSDAILIIPLPWFINDKEKDGITFKSSGKINETYKELDYRSISQFTKNAPDSQQQKLWKEVASKLSKELEKSGSPRWLNTHGTGVHYLHVRIDERPKYYQFEEYKEFKTESKDEPNKPEQNGNKFSLIFKFEKVERDSKNNTFWWNFISEDDQYRIEINVENSVIREKGSNIKKGEWYKVSWKETEKDKRRFEKGDFVEIEEHKKNDNSDPSDNNDQNQTPPPDFKPQIDTSQINNTKDIKEAHTKAQEQIKKMLSESKVQISQLNKSLWENQENWEKYLETLSDKEKVNNFLTKMKEAIEKQYKINSSQMPPKKPQSKNEPENGSWWPLILFLVLVFLLVVGIILVIWLRGKRIGKKPKKEKLK